MESYCEHYVQGDDDENFLLDDQNAFMKKCLRCRQQTRRIIWPTSQSEMTWINDTDSLGTTVVMDEHIDTLEDSPLLINDNYTSSDDDFHCHSVIIQSEDKKAWKKLLIASLLCFLFMIVELVGGFIADSLAIMTDAAHLFSDFVGFLISLLSIYIARKAPTKNMTFGYYRAEVLGAFLSVLTVWLLAGIFATLAINRLWKQEYEIEANTMMLVASLGLIVNFVMGGVLYGGCHNHSHGLSQAQTSCQSNSNINVRAATAHVLGDLLQSFGVLVAAITIKIFPNAQIADPICTLFFSFLVIFTTAKVARDAIWLLLEGSPKNSGDLYFELQRLPSVRHIHNLHIWTLSPGKDVVSTHLCVDKYCDRDLILKKATTLIKSRMNIVSCTVQIESYNEDLINSCSRCKPLQC